MSQLMTIKLSKSDASMPWGFRLQGGLDFATPLCIQKVNSGSVAEKAGLQVGDSIVSIAGSDALKLRHKEAQETILKAGSQFDMVVQRGQKAWKPTVTPLTETKITTESIKVSTSTSLTATKKVNGQKIVNAQYNTPLNLYSEDNIAETLSAQAEVLGKGVIGINFKKFEREVKLRTDSPTYKLLHGNEEPEKPRKPRQAPPEETTAASSQPVFPARPVGLPGQPGQQGYYNINEKLYCDVHAKQAARHHPPAPNVEPVTVKPGAPVPPSAMTAVQAQVKAPTAPAPAPAPIPEPPAPAPVKEPQPQPAPPVVPAPQPEPIPAPQPEPTVKAEVEAAPAPAPVQSQPEPEHVPAPAPAPAPKLAPAAPVVAPPPVFTPAKAPALQQTSANIAGFGAPAGDADVRSHIPKKGGAPVFATAPAPKPVSGFSDMPKPTPPPTMGGDYKPPPRGVPQPGQRTTPRRGRGVMNQAATSRIPMCATCQRQIRGPFVSALGKTWCPDHFICATDTCRKPLIEMGFVEEQGALYCEDCYEKYLAPICGKCDKRIKGDCLNAVGKQFHPECFCCAYCGKMFGSGAFYLEDGLPYCETDWNELFTTKCVGCGFPIEAGDRWVEALNNNYHSQCFKCSKCNKNLEGQSFFAKGGKPFCKAHAQRGF